MRLNFALLVGASVFSFSGAGALAQTAASETKGGQAAPGAQSEAAVLEDVLVTARRRTESLQDVPVAVTAVSDRKSVV